jgi:hypothetical protein
MCCTERRRTGTPARGRPGGVVKILARQAHRSSTGEWPGNGMTSAGDARCATGCNLGTVSGRSPSHEETSGEEMKATESDVAVLWDCCLKSRVVDGNDTTSEEWHFAKAVQSARAGRPPGQQSHSAQLPATPPNSLKSARVQASSICIPIYHALCLTQVARRATLWVDRRTVS